MDPQRCEELFRQHARSLIRYCAFSTGSWQDGEDIAAEVFARLLRRSRPLPDDAVAPWLFVVARNLCRSQHRKSMRQVRLVRDLAEGFSESAPAWVDRTVWEYVRALKEDARLIVFLHTVEGRPFSEIATLLGKSVSAVKMTHYRGLERIRQRMHADDIRAASDLLGGPNDA